MAAVAQGTAISKRRKFVADGVFYAELNEFFQRELAEEGYSGVEVRVTPTVTDISMPTTNTVSPCRDLPPLIIAQSFALLTLKRSLESKDGAFGSLHRSSKSVSNFPKTPSHFTLPKFKTGVSPPLHNANLYAISC